MVTYTFHKHLLSIINRSDIAYYKKAIIDHFAEYDVKIKIFRTSSQSRILYIKIYAEQYDSFVKEHSLYNCIEIRIGCYNNPRFFSIYLDKVVVA